LFDDGISLRCEIPFTALMARKIFGKKNIPISKPLVSIEIAILIDIPMLSKSSGNDMCFVILSLVIHTKARDC
jgi:hypothetical protein